MNKRNRILATVALTLAGAGAAATPAQALAGLDQPGGLFGAAAFALTDLTTGQSVSSMIPNSNDIAEKVKEQQKAQQQH